MNVETALSLHARIEADQLSSNLYARANARYILLGVDEPRENFPLTLEVNLDNGAGALAFSYLSIACTLFESNGNDSQLIQSCFEKGAEFLEYTHLPRQNRSEISQYYLLVSALAYYAAQQYSKSFIVVKEAENYNTDFAKICSFFLKKNYNSLHELLNEVLIIGYLSDEFEDDRLLKRQRVYIFARSIANLMDYLYSGNLESLNTAIEIQSDLLELLQIENEPAMWWAVRIFRIISSGFKESSLWVNILPRFPRKKKLIAKKYVNNLIFGKKPITELFAAQRHSLPFVFNPKGAVISLPTSSGKTQIAALGILHCLLENPDGKILYLAPYRSLAFEVENTLKQIFEPLSFEVSQLYGSGQFSKLDNLIIENAHVLIATPEKAKVILRANVDTSQQIKLVIIDEGHLLDESKRNVTNELFVEELKACLSDNHGKILLLSAVLPNASDISKWITGDSNRVIHGKERLARQRLGIFEFVSHRNVVNLEWIGEEKSYNRGFVRPFPKKGNQNIQPDKKADAIAHVALKLANPIKTTLIFTARARSARPYARAVLKALKTLDQHRVTHTWSDQIAWDEFKLLCAEYDCEENKELVRFAEFGVLCHYGGLNKDVRLSMESLMKSANPRIIIATMTLGQGVNLGVSSIIIADTKFFDVKTKNEKRLTNSEVWNIIGRAGRAFQDIEGKILFFVETKEDRIDAMSYIEGQPAEAFSGLLKNIRRIISIAKQCDIEFEQLIEMISNNDLGAFKTWSLKKTGANIQDEFEDIFDWIDDTLLSFNIRMDESERNIDKAFRTTLAYIQAERYPGIEQLEVFEFLKARNFAITKVILPDKNSWRSIASSSLPMASALALDSAYQELVDLGEVYIRSKKRINDRVTLLKAVESLIEKFPSSAFKPKVDHNGALKYSTTFVDQVRKIWISGGSLADASQMDTAISLCYEYFSFTITWVLGAIANKFKIKGRDDLSDIFESLALSCELGLPNKDTSKLYLVGIRSRIAVMEISETLTYMLYFPEGTIKDARNFVLNYMPNLLKEVENPVTVAWLNKIRKNNEDLSPMPYKFPIFELPFYPNIKTTKLYVKGGPKRFLLCSPDYTEQYPIKSTKALPFGKFSNKMDYFFELTNGAWHLKSAIS